MFHFVGSMMHIEEAIRSRKSVRRFLSDPVPQSTIKHILEAASQAPSGNNIQPWRVQVVTGALRDTLCNDVLKAARCDEAEPGYAYYPDPWFEPYLSRRQVNGFRLYEALNIDKEDTAARQDQALRNFVFFDAPVGILVILDRRLSAGSFLDVGMFMQNVLLMARAHGLHTCPQVSFSRFHKVVRRHLPLTENDVLVCAIALGYENPEAPENHLHTPRIPVADFAQFHGFD